MKMRVMHSRGSYIKTLIGTGPRIDIGPRGMLVAGPVAV
jgi:hypothetical protein